MKSTNGMAIASLVCGILGLVLFWACFVGVVISIVAVVLGFLGRNKAKQLPGESGSGVALAGIITGGIGVLAGIAMLVLFFVGSSSTTDIGDMGDFNSDPSDGICNEDRFWEDPDC